jgi:lipid-binding SYLF domain-containing protein
MDSLHAFGIDTASPKKAQHDEETRALRRFLPFSCLFLALILPCRAGAAADPVSAARLQESLKTLSQVIASPQTTIPAALLQKATAIVIIPNMVKASFLVGARYGKGVLMARGEDGRWGNPVLVSLGGGSFGLQMGVQSTDLVLVFRRGRVLDMKTKGNVLLGADVSIVAGTLSLTMDENTGADLGTEIYSFSRSRGLNAGFALQGAHLRLDDAATAGLYGKSSLTAQDVLAGKIDTISTDVLRFRDGFSRLTGSAP